MRCTDRRIRIFERVDGVVRVRRGCRCDGRFHSQDCRERLGRGGNRGRWESAKTSVREGTTGRESRRGVIMPIHSHSRVRASSTELLVLLLLHIFAH